MHVHKKGRPAVKAERSAAPGVVKAVLIGYRTGLALPEQLSVTRGQHYKLGAPFCGGDTRCKYWYTTGCPAEGRQLVSILEYEFCVVLVLLRVAYLVRTSIDSTSTIYIVSSLLADLRVNSPLPGYRALRSSSLMSSCHHRK